MFKACTIALTLSVTALLGTATAQDYPNKPIRVLAAEVGGILDLAARLMAKDLAVVLGQPIVVENRGSGIMGDLAAQSSPDGYTLLVTGGALWAEPLLRHNSFDTLKALTPITIATRSPNIVAVHPSLPVNSIKDLIALAKAKPGVLNYSSSTAGTSSHLAGELFKSLAGVNIVRIPYKGTGAALNALIGNEVQVMFPNVGAEPSRKAGKIKGIAVTSAQPSMLFPDLPTVASTVPGYESVSVIAVFAPAKTPAAIISRLNRELVRILNRPDVKERFLNTGAEVVASTPEQLAANVKSETARLAKLIKDTGMRAD